MSRFLQRVRSASGVTIIEITLVLTATMALAAALAPTLASVIQDARQTVAIQYALDLSIAINNAVANISFPEFKTDGDGKGGDDTVRLLVSDGDIPDGCTVSVTDGCGVRRRRRRRRKRAGSVPCSRSAFAPAAFSGSSTFSTTT